MLLHGANDLGLERGDGADVLLKHAPDVVRSKNADGVVGNQAVVLQFRMPPPDHPRNLRTDRGKRHDFMVGELFLCNGASLHGVRSGERTRMLLQGRRELREH